MAKNVVECYGPSFHSTPCQKGYVAECIIEFETGVRHHFCAWCADWMLHRYECKVVELL